MSTNTTTALTTIGYTNADPLAMVKSLGTAIMRAQAFKVANQEAGEYIAWICVHERKAPHQLEATHHFIAGKLTPKADYVHAEFLKEGGEIEWIDLGEGGQRAEATLAFKNRGKIKMAYTIEQAKQCGLYRGDSRWDKDPATMLRARVITRGIRILHPELFIRIGDPDTGNYGVVAEEKSAGSQLLNVEPAPVPVPKAIDVQVVVGEPKYAELPKEEPATPAPEPTVLPKPAPAPDLTIESTVRLAREVSAIIDAKSLDEKHTIAWLSAMSPEFAKSQRLEDCKLGLLKSIVKYPDKWASDVRAWKPKA